MLSKRKLIGGMVCVLLVAVGCSSSKTSPSSTTTAGGASSTVPNAGTYTIGVLTDATGPAASGNKTAPQGAQAGAVSLAAKAGYTLKFVVGDTTTSPAGALSAAQKLVEQDHVLAVIAVSALTFGAASYLTSKGVPVVGVAEDGPEWLTATNMFSVYGPIDSTKVATTMGDFFKKEGATVVGALGYGISPPSAESAKGATASAAAAGLKVGYLNAQFPFGSTNVQPVALAMKSSGVNGFTASTDPNTGFALITALRQAGADLKVPLLATGYGGDLLQAGAAAQQAAQNVYFLTPYEPLEMHTPATDQFQSALTTAGIATAPTYAEYSGYASVALLVDALKAAGPNPTSSSLIAALNGIKDFDAAGLLGSHSLDMSSRVGGLGPDNCFWATKWVGSAFQLVDGADPICGTIVPGKTVSPSS